MSYDAELEARLTRYCAIDSQSDPDSPTTPSTAAQFDMLNLLVAELTELGAEEVQLTDYGVVLATIPGAPGYEGPTIGFLAHVDTAPQYHASGVKPRVHRGYNGGAISFPLNPALSLSPETSPELAKKTGHTIITASGDTLLGADDKAGVAILMTAARALLATPGARLRLAFTPDEEIGRGVSPRLPADMAADFAYTFDGGKLGEIEYESFSADGAVVTITGVSIHPGYATGKMVNATTLAARLLLALPQDQTPEATADRDGFLHVTDMAGGSSEMTVRLILRDFEREGLAAKGKLLQEACARLQSEEPRAKITCQIKPQYRNMRYWLETDMTPVTRAVEAARAIGLTPRSTPIRGGTDGSRLTEMGLPCPNLFTGMAEIHGPLEWISVQDMASATALLLEIAKA
jgi:tripeptide aminopeptidase